MILYYNYTITKENIKGHNLAVLYHSLYLPNCFFFINLIKAYNLTVCVVCMILYLSGIYWIWKAVKAKVLVWELFQKNT